MKKCYDCGQPIEERRWRCQDCFTALWPKRTKRYRSPEKQRRLIERLVSERKQEEQQRLAEEMHCLTLMLQAGHEEQTIETVKKQSEGKIYFISDEHDRIKIGYSGYPKRRLKDLQSSNADKLTLLVTISGNKETESTIQAHFSHLKVRDTEWFTAAPALLNYIDQLCVPDGDH